MNLQQIDNQINALEASLASLRAQRQQIVEEQNALNEQKVAYENALSSLFDGVKYVADATNPFPISAYPIEVYPNMYYKTSYNDGVKEIVHKYVCVAIEPTMLTEDNFADVLTEWFD